MLTAQNKAEISQYLLENHMPNRRDRWFFHDTFTQRPITETLSDVALSGVTQAQNRVLQAANANWGVSGTNIGSAAASSFSNGGVLLSTHTGSGDQVLLSPKTANAGAVALSAIGGTTGTSSPTTPFLSTNAPIMEVVLELPAIANIRLVCGFKLTTATATGTDDDKVMIAFDTGSSVSATKFRLVSSTANTDYDVEAKTNSTTPRSVVAASTKYVLTVGVLPTNRVPFFAINGDVVAGSPNNPALTNGCGFIPVIGLEALAAGAKTMIVRSVSLSRAY